MNQLANRIYLASRSPRRRELLKQVGIAFEILLFREDPSRGVDVDESVHPGENPHDYVLRIARTKAAVGMQQLARRRLLVHPVLAADTAVVVDQRILGKPRGAADAADMLRLLSGRSHEVLTSIAVCLHERVETRVSTSRVEFVTIAQERINRYVATGEPFDKAGAYAIQGRAGAFVRHLAGSYSGVMGLPLCETVELLESFGVGA